MERVCHAWEQHKLKHEKHEKHEKHATMQAALVRLTRSLAKPSLPIVDVKFSLLLTVVIQVDKQTMDHCKIKMF